MGKVLRCSAVIVSLTAIAAAAAVTVCPLEWPKSLSAAIPASTAPWNASFGVNAGTLAEAKAMLAKYPRNISDAPNDRKQRLPGF